MQGSARAKVTSDKSTSGGEGGGGKIGQWRWSSSGEDMVPNQGCWVEASKRELFSLHIPSTLRKVFKSVRGWTMDVWEGYGGT